MKSDKTYSVDFIVSVLGKNIRLRRKVRRLEVEIADLEDEISDLEKTVSSLSEQLKDAEELGEATR